MIRYKCSVVVSKKTSKILKKDSDRKPIDLLIKTSKSFRRIVDKNWKIWFLNRKNLQVNA